MSVLTAGANGATGRHLINQFLRKGNNGKMIRLAMKK